MPMLDLLTVPAFAYLLLILMLFGFCTVVGLIASILYRFHQWRVIRLLAQGIPGSH